MSYESNWPPYLVWLQRLIHPHGLRCLWFCPPWHRPGCYPTWDELKAMDK